MEFKESERLRNERRELFAKSLEQKAEDIWSQCISAEDMNLNFSSHLEERDAGTLNLSLHYPLLSKFPSSELKIIIIINIIKVV